MIKLTGIEKKMIAVVFFISLLLTVVISYELKRIEEAGGIKGIIIEVGKEVKDIKKQIAEGD